MVGLTYKYFQFRSGRQVKARQDPTTGVRHSLERGDPRGPASTLAHSRLCRLDAAHLHLRPPVVYGLCNSPTRSAFTSRDISHLRGCHNVSLRQTEDSPTSLTDENSIRLRAFTGYLIELSEQFSLALLCCGTNNELKRKARGWLLINNSTSIMMGIRVIFVHSRWYVRFNSPTLQQFCCTSISIELISKRFPKALGSRLTLVNQV